MSSFVLVKICFVLLIGLSLVSVIVRCVLCLCYIQFEVCYIVQFALRLEYGTWTKVCCSSCWCSEVCLVNALVCLLVKVSL